MRRKRKLPYSIKLEQWLDRENKYMFMTFTKSEQFKYILTEELTDIDLFELGYEFGKFDSQTVG